MSRCAEYITDQSVICCAGPHFDYRRSAGKGSSSNIACASPIDTRQSHKECLCATRCSSSLWLLRPPAWPRVPRPKPQPDPGAGGAHPHRWQPQSAGGSVMSTRARCKCAHRIPLEFPRRRKDASSRAVDLGDSVKAGQVLAQLDPQDLRLGQDASRADGGGRASRLSTRTPPTSSATRICTTQGFIGQVPSSNGATSAMKTARAQLEQAKAQSSVQGNQAELFDGAARRRQRCDHCASIIEPGMVVSLRAHRYLRLAHDGPRDVVFAVPEDKVGVVPRRWPLNQAASRCRLWGADRVNRWRPRSARFLRPPTRSRAPSSIKADIGNAAANWHPARADRLGARWNCRRPPA